MKDENMTPHSANEPWKVMMTEAFLGLNTSAQEHPDVELLAAYAEANLKEEERTQIEGHLSRCAECLDLLRGLSSRLQRDHTVQSYSAPRQRTLFRYLAAASIVIAVAGFIWGFREFVSRSNLEVEKQQLSDRLTDAQWRLATLSQEHFFAAHSSPIRGYWIGNASAKTLQLPQVRGTRPMTSDAQAAYQQAREALEALIENTPKARGQALLDLVSLHLNAGRPGDAEQVLLQASQLPGNSVEVRNARAVTALSSADKDTISRGVAALEELTKAEPDFLPAWYNLGLAYSALFRDEDARRAWREYLRRETRVEYRKAAEEHLARLAR